jgi:hypothetical protein
MRCLPVAHLFPMMLDHATGRCPDEGMMSGDMTYNAAHGGALQTSLGLRAGRHPHANCQSYNDGRNRTHFSSPSSWSVAAEHRNAPKGCKAHD